MKIEQVIKQEKFKDLYEKVVVNLIYTSNWMRDKQNQTFRNYDILPQHYNVLRILKGRYPNPVSPGQIKEVMLDKGTDVTRLIDKLVNKELAKRGLCESNRRKMDVVLTEKGLQLLEELEKPMQILKDQLKVQLTEQEAGMLSNLLDKLRN
jgi:DNA-binding MarR family transcriptional regulator